MLLAIDIGNTNVTLGVYGDTLLCTARLSTDKRQTADQYAIELKDVLALNGIKTQDITGAVMASVVASVGKAVKDAIIKLCGINPIVVGPGIKTGLNIKIDNPASLGADLVAAAVAVVAKYLSPAIVIDFGTATTFSVLNKEGCMIGGAIAAGVNLTLGALALNADQLHSVSIEAPTSPIGSNTEDCIRSGLLYGTASMVDGMVQSFEQELGEKATVIATGGLAPLIVPLCKSEIAVDDNLLLEGLKIIYVKNAGK